MFLTYVFDFVSVLIQVTRHSTTEIWKDWKVVYLFEQSSQQLETDPR